MRLGPENLSLPELIAILLRTGDQKKSALVLAQELVQSFQGDQLFRASFDQFLAFDGIKKAKAVTLAAAVELARRIRSGSPDPLSLSSPDAAGHFLMERYAHSRKELFGIILLDSQNRLILEKVLHEGTTRFAPVEPRFVFAPAINTHAARVIIYHTHPSGDPSPSDDDLRFTSKLTEAGDLLGIPVADHIVVGMDGYYSFRNHRRM